MKIETHKQENSILELTVEVDEERVQPALRAAARQLAKRYPVPGFRPGKAPYDVILRQFGEGALYEAAVEDLGQKVYAEALEQEKIDAYGPGALEDVQLKPMVLKFSVPLRPEVELGDYRALQLPYTPTEIKDEQVNEALEHLREHQAVMEPVDRPAELTDVAVLDVKPDEGYMSGQFGHLALINKAPHPNAAKVYINWLLAPARREDRLAGAGLCAIHRGPEGRRGEEI